VVTVLVELLPLAIVTVLAALLFKRVKARDARRGIQRDNRRSLTLAAVALVGYFGGAVAVWAIASALTSDQGTVDNAVGAYQLTLLSVALLLQVGRWWRHRSSH
jgi:hypothetical protein